MKKYYSYLLVILLTLTHTNSYSSLYYNWAKRFGDAGTNVDIGTSIISDKQGNVYVTGLFKGTVDFDPGAGIFNLTAGGIAQNIFFAKYNANGNFIWAKHIGDANLSKGLGIQVDDTGNVYLLANFELSTSIDFDPNAGVANISGQGNKTIAFAKYTTAGDYVWAKSINGNSDCYSTSLTLDPLGNIYLAGKFYFTADFDPSVAVSNITAVGSANGFFAKYDNLGNFIWVKQLTGGAVEITKQVLDNTGNIYITGYYRTSCDFDPGVGTYPILNDGNGDFFVGCYTENGLLTWAIALDGTNEDNATDIAIDANHNVYVVGTFIDSLETDPSPFVDNYVVSTNAGVADNFVAKYNSIGAAVWAFRIGNVQTDICNGVAVTASGEVFITGAFTGNMDFDPNAGFEILSGGSNYNIYLAAYDTYGNYIFAKSIGGAVFDEVSDISMDLDATIYLTGNFGDDVDFEISADTALLSGGTADIFMAKYSRFEPIVIQKPYSNSTWLVNADYPIDWYAYGVDSVKIERQRQGQSGWELISKVEASQSPYIYNLPSNNPLDVYKIKVSDLFNKTVKSERNVRIKFAPQLNYPVGGEVFAADSIITVNWFASQANAAFFDLKYSTNAGANWTLIRDSVQTYFDNDSSFFIGNYNWKIPRNSNSSNCLIGIFINNTSTPLIASTAFTIQASNPTSFNIVSPNGGESLERRRHHYITWNGVSMPPVVVLWYSLDGTTYEIIDTIPNLGYYDWIVRDTVSSYCFIKISNLAASISDESNSEFEIVNSSNDEAELLAPIAGDKWCVGTQQNIRWISNVNGKVVLYYKAGSGGYQLIDTVDASNGLYSWTIPNTPDLKAKVRIEPADGSGQNLSTSDEFVLCSDSIYARIISPNGGESFYPGSYKPIVWKQNNIDKINLEYSTDNGANWDLIEDSLDASPYFWLIPNSPSTTSLVRTSATDGSLYGDTSNAVFTIRVPFAGLAPSITTATLAQNACKNDTFNVFYTVSGGVFDTTNIFVVQLTDSVGSFVGTLTAIGSRKDSVSGVISCVIPEKLRNSNLYRVRVVADNPPAIGIPSAAFDLSSPQFTFKDTAYYCFLPNAAMQFPAITMAPGVTLEWNFGDGVSAAVQQPNHVYSQVGIFDVTLTATDTLSGCAISKTNKAYVRVDKKFPNRILNPNKNATITGMSFKNDSTGTISFSDGSVKFTNDNGDNWYSVQPTGLTDVKGIKVRTATDWIAVGGNGGVRRTSNRGLSWDTVTFANGLAPTVQFNAIDFSSPLSGYIVGDSGKVFRFGNGKFNLGPKLGSGNLYTVYDDGNNAYAAGDSGQVFKRRITPVVKWDTMNSGIKDAIRTLIFGSVNSNKGYACADNGKIIQTTDAGETWTTTLAGVDVDFSSIACSEYGDSAWAVGEFGIIYQTLDRGQTWERFSKGATSSNTKIAYKLPKGYLAGSSGSLRIFNPINSGLPLGIKSFAKQASASFSIFPNPAVNEFTIELNSKQDSKLKIVVKDLKGNEILVVANEWSKGTYRKNVDATKLVSGVYFVHITKDDQYLVKKIVVVK